ncbi:ATP-binding protein [Sphingomonas sanguinis]|uniref:Adenylate kinase n=1 Tax=Sphingomonas sanguinis TaxID=33051 RepID=A0A147IXN2_9SPHN|nr:ATP-binding protein [Sphingomonas sanguinis]KTW00509.1 hypothetical protein SB4_06935 [Sphingomonas sanguinis]
MSGQEHEDGPVVGLFGISGVGKTRFASALVELNPEVLHLQASALLRRASGLGNEALRTANRNQLVANQSALALATEQARSGQRERPVLIDAHSVIDNDIELVDVPFDAIQPLNIETYIFLRASPSSIIQRRSASTRSRPLRSAEELAKHQSRALAVCREYADSSGRPLVIINVPDGAVPPEALTLATKQFDRRRM